MCLCEYIASDYHKNYINIRLLDIRRDIISDSGTRTSSDW